MIEANPTDLFEVRKESLFSSLDSDYLLDLYAPMIGMKAAALYLALLHVEEGGSSSFESFLKKNLSSIGEFSTSILPLEATGLVQSFVKKGDKFNYFILCLFAPRSPKEFFDNILFVGTLRKYLDNDKVTALAKKYALLPLPEDATNVSMSFREYFAPDLSETPYQNGTLSSGGHLVGKVSTGFDKNLFLKALIDLDPRYGPSCFSKEQIVKVARLAALYSYSEESMASFVKDSYDFSLPLGERLSFNHLEELAEKNLRYDYLKSSSKAPSPLEEVHGDTALAKSLRSMDSLTPQEFLTRLQHGNKPASADLRLLSSLVVDMGLSHGATNALILYMIVQNNGILSRAYMEKLAGSLVRANITNALDAMNYLQKSPAKGPRIEKKSEPNTPLLQVSSPDEEVSDEEFNSLMKDLYTEKKAA